MKKTQTKKPIAVFITDTHLDEENVELNKSIHKQARDLAKSLGLTNVDHGGDIFDSRKSQPQNNLTAFQSILDEYAEDGMILHSTVGNHDKVNYRSYDSYLDSFVHHPNFDLYRSVGGRPLTGNIILHYAAFIEDDLYIQMMNDYIASMKTFYEKQKGLKHILLTHVGIASAKMNNGKVIESSITAKLFEFFNQVYVGHYHDAQVIADFIYYFGASFQHNFGESPNKGAWIIYDDLSSELHRFKFPRYITQKLNVSKKEITVEKVEELKDIRETGDFVRTVLTGKEEDIKSFNAQTLKDLGIKVVKEQDALIQADIEELVQAFDNKSLTDAFSDFCKKNKLNHKEGIKYLNKIIQ